jgi:hypothetical protein
MAFFKKNQSPPMSEVRPGGILLKLTPSRTKQDCLKLIIHISEGIYGNRDNNAPKFKNLEQFDAAVAELSGSLDVELLNEAIKVFVVDVRYMNRFCDVVVNQINLGLEELKTFLNLNIPLSVASITAIKPAKEQLEFLIQSLASLAGNKSLGIETSQLVSISSTFNVYRDFMVSWLHEMERSMRYIEDFRNQ